MACPRTPNQVLLDDHQAERYGRLMSRPRSSPASAVIPVGAAEIAERLGVKPQTVHMWRHRELMPEPRWTVSGQPAWSWQDIEAWARRTGRLRERNLHAELLALAGIGWDGNLDEMRSSRVGRK